MRDIRQQHPSRLKQGLLCFLLLLGGLIRIPAMDDSLAPDDPTYFKFARVQFNSYSFRSRNPGWAHDYPRADRNFLRILSEVTSIKTTAESFVVVRLEDPAIMDYPFLYFSEPGEWSITEEEASNFRAYLDKGGFAIFDDFDGPSDWFNFVGSMRQVFPDRTFEELTIDHPVFHCFYEIETLDMEPPYMVRGKPTFYGLFDETGELQVVANFNNDIGDFWEWSDEGFHPIHLSNEAYKFGVNYVIYALTH